MKMNNINSTSYLTIGAHSFKTNVTESVFPIKMLHGIGEMLQSIGEFDRSHNLDFDWIQSDWIVRLKKKTSTIRKARTFRHNGDPFKSLR